VRPPSFSQVGVRTGRAELHLRFLTHHYCHFQDTMEPSCSTLRFVFYYRRGEPVLCTSRSISLELG